MNCDKMLKLIHGMLDGVLDDATTHQLKAHLEKCPGCARKLDELSRLRGIFRGMVAAPPPELRGRILDALAAESGSRAPAVASARPFVASVRPSDAARVLVLCRRAAVAALVFLAITAAFFFGGNGRLVANPDRIHYEDLFAVKRPAEALEILVRTSDPQSIPPELLQGE